MRVFLVDAGGTGGGEPAHERGQNPTAANGTDAGTSTTPPPTTGDRQSVTPHRVHILHYIHPNNIIYIFNNDNIGKYLIQTWTYVIE